jgi:hypothetical protein
VRSGRYCERDRQCPQALAPRVVPAMSNLPEKSKTRRQRHSSENARTRAESQTSVKALLEHARSNPPHTRRKDNRCRSAMRQNLNQQSAMAHVCDNPATSLRCRVSDAPQRASTIVASNQTERLHRRRDRRESHARRAPERRSLIPEMPSLIAGYAF